MFKRERKEVEYTIRSYATGALLDMFCSREQPGTLVIGHSAYGRPNQLWTFYATRSAAGYAAYKIALGGL